MVRDQILWGKIILLAGKNKELQKIIDLNYKGKASEGKKKLVEYEKRNHRPETLIRIELIKLSLFSPRGDLEKSIALIDQVVSKCKTIDNPLLMISALYAKSLDLTMIRKFEESNIVIEEAIELLNEKINKEIDDYKLQKANLLFLRGYNYSSLGEFDQSQEIAKQAFSISEKLNDIRLKLNLFDLLGAIDDEYSEIEEAIEYFTKGYELAIKNGFISYENLFTIKLANDYVYIGNIELAKKFINKSIELYKKTNQDLSSLYLLQGIFYRELGELEKGVAFFNKAIPLLEKYTSNWLRAIVLRLKAGHEQRFGNINKAIDYISEAIELVRNDNINHLIYIKSTQAKILFDKGEFEETLQTCYSCLEIIEENRNQKDIALIYETMGRVFHIKGDYNLAIEYTQRGLEIWKRFNTRLHIAQSLFILIEISIDKDDKKLYTSYLSDLETFVKSYSTNFFEKMYQTAYALVLKNSTRPRDWIKAIDILIEVVNTDLPKYEFSLVALISLCELLMSEYSMSGDSQVLEELEFYADKLHILSEEQNVYHLRLEAYNFQILINWLVAQKTTIELDFQKAKNLLTDITEIADGKGLNMLAEKLTRKQEKLLDQLSQWDDFIRKYYEFINE